MFLIPDLDFWMILIIFTIPNKAVYLKSDFYMVWKGESPNPSPERAPRMLRGHVPDS